MNVSVLNCCCLQEQYFPDVVRSIRGQHFLGSLEIFCHHNGCQTGNPEGRGPAMARNEAAQRSSGQWLLWNDGDNLLPSNYVQALWAAKEQAKRDLEVPEEKLIIGCPVQFISGLELARIMNHQPGYYALKHQPKLRVFQPGLIYSFENEIPISISSLVHRSAWEEVKGFEDEFAPTEDLHFWAKLMTKGYVYVHTRETSLLKNNLNTISLRTPPVEMQAAVKKINQALNLQLEPWTIIG